MRNKRYLLRWRTHIRLNGNHKRDWFKYYLCRPFYPLIEIILFCKTLKEYEHTL